MNSRMSTKNKSGFTTIEALIIGAVVVVIGLVGFFVYSSQTKTKTPQGKKMVTNNNQEDQLHSDKLTSNKSSLEIKEWSVQSLRGYLPSNKTISHFTYTINGSTFKLIPIKLDNPDVVSCIPVIERYNENAKLEFPNGEFSAQNVGEYLSSNSSGYTWKKVNNNYYILWKGNGTCGRDNSYYDSAVLSYSKEVVDAILNMLEPLSKSNQ